MRPRGDVARAVKQSASRFPGAEEGVACAGTSLESTTWNVKGKAFVFAAVKDGVCSIRVKLQESAAEARALAKAQPARCSVGAGNWAKLTWPKDQKAPVKLMARWIAESHRAVTG